MPPKKKNTAEPAAKKAAVASEPLPPTLDSNDTQDVDLERTLSTRKSTGGPVITEEMCFQGTTDFKRLTADSEFNAATMLKIISWNVAGLRGFLNRGGDLTKFCQDESPDVLCLQECKLSDWEDCPKLGVVDGYSFVDSISVAKKGYSGTRTYVRSGLKNTNAFGFDVAKPSVHDEEGRVVTTVLHDLADIAVVNCYVPNSGMTLERLDYRTEDFDPMMRKFLSALNAKKGGGGCIWTGDLNVAERDYDRFWGGNFKQMQKSPGFTPEERQSFRETLSATNMVDAFRAKYPTAAKAGTYTFWSARFNQRAKGNGWRLDYFVVSASLVPRIVDCFPMPNYTQSDHCPLVLWLRRK